MELRLPIDFVCISHETIYTNTDLLRRRVKDWLSVLPNV
jgi:hypothetical protein